MKIHANICPSEMGEGWIDQREVATALAGHLAELYQDLCPESEVSVSVQDKPGSLSIESSSGSSIAPSLRRDIEELYHKVRTEWPATAIARFYALVPHTVRIDETGVRVYGESGLIARFGSSGVDIRRPASGQSAESSSIASNFIEPGDECVYSTRAITVSQDWDIFVMKMFEYFYIRIHPGHKPKRLR